MALKAYFHPVNSCGHLGIDHVAEIPLCEKIPLWQKVATIAFHLLTFGIPLAIFHLTKDRFPYLYYPKNGVEDLKLIAIEAVATKNGKPYTLPITKQALTLARRKLLENSHVTPSKFKGKEPVNREIALLKTLLDLIYLPRLKEALKTNIVDPWSCPEVLKAADTALKISYAVSSLTLDDQPDFVEKYPEKPTLIAAITAKNSYQSQTFFSFLSVYDKVRGGIYFNPATKKFEFPPLEDPIHTGFFFKPEDQKAGWKDLYNDYSSRVRAYLPEHELRAANPRHVDWTLPDLVDVPFAPRR